MKGLTDIPGIRVGHISDFEALTGCTAILAEGGAVAGVHIGGAATGSQEIDVLSPLHVTPHIHGICLAGGSAFGLEAASGVRNHLEANGTGFTFGGVKVPIVPAAILFDLGFGGTRMAESGCRPALVRRLASGASRSSPLNHLSVLWG